jgi:hypothetical protein
MCESGPAGAAADHDHLKIAFHIGCILSVERSVSRASHLYDVLVWITDEADIYFPCIHYFAVSSVIH